MPNPQTELAHGADQTQRELWRLGIVACVFALCGVLTYAVPGSERVRPWLAGEGLPIARMYADGNDVLPGFAEASVHTNVDVSAKQIERQLGTQIARNVGAADAAEPRTQGPAGAMPAIAPTEYEGITQQIEYPEALAKFFASLEQTALQKPTAHTRVAHYGDSAVAADGITSTLRRRMQQRFGDAGHGFVLIARGDMHYNHRDVVQRSSDGWRVMSIVRDGLRPGFYGYGGVQARAQAGQHAFFGTMDEGERGRSVSSFELFYQRFRGGGALEIKVDGKKHSTLQTHGDAIEDAFERVEVPDGPHTFTLRMLGSETHLYGVALERSVPGVVYDSLGLVGARADRLLNAEPAHMRKQIAHRNPDLLVLSFGGNESANAWLNPDRYERDLEKVVRFMRSAKPEMACLLFGPLDQAERNERGQIVTLPIMPKIVAAQRRVAEREKCAFFDAFSAMGGEGAMAAWQKSRPRLGTSDLRHATPAGYEVIGNLYYKAILKAFADYLAAHPAR